MCAVVALIAPAASSADDTSAVAQIAPEVYAESVAVEDMQSSTGSVAHSSTTGVSVALPDSGRDSLVVKDGSTVIDVCLPDENKSSDLNVENGSVVAWNADGGYSFGISAPWALDANGVQVPTHFEVRGLELVQVVSHTSGSYRDPIVADPWFGIDLYRNVYISTGRDADGSGWKINATPTVWGRQNRSRPMWWAHRDEVRAKAGRWNT